MFNGTKHLRIYDKFPCDKNHMGINHVYCSSFNLSVQVYKFKIVLLFSVNMSIPLHFSVCDWLQISCPILRPAMCS